MIDETEKIIVEVTDDIKLSKVRSELSTNQPEMSTHQHDMSTHQHEMSMQANNNNIEYYLCIASCESLWILLDIPVSE